MKNNALKPYTGGLGINKFLISRKNPLELAEREIAARIEANHERREVSVAVFGQVVE